MFQQSDAQRDPNLSTSLCSTRFAFLLEDQTIDIVVSSIVSQHPNKSITIR